MPITVPVLLAMSCLGKEPDSLIGLQLIARVAEVMLDGDMCLRIQTPRSLRFSHIEDPRDRWRAADNYDVDDEAFTQTKKTLIRLSHLCPETCDVNLWMPLAGRPGRVAIVIRNVHELSQFWRWGDLDQETPPEMRPVLEKGERVTVQRRPGMTAVLAPVRDSLASVVALVEVASQKDRNLRENVK
jgi:hypothetical protein